MKQRVCSLSFLRLHPQDDADVKLEISLALFFILVPICQKNILALQKIPD